MKRKCSRHAGRDWSDTANDGKVARATTTALALLLGALVVVTVPRTATALGTSWQIATVDQEDAFAYNSAIALDSQGRAHIAYSTLFATDLRYARWMGDGWEIQIVDANGNVGSYPSIALDANDYAHISYYDAINGNLKYASWNGTTWRIEAVDTAGVVGAYTSLVLDSNDYPHVSYHDATNQDLKYAGWNGSAWNIETVDWGGSVGTDTSIAVDSGDNAWISYYDITNKDLKCAHSGISGWTIEMVDSLGDVGGFSSLAVNKSGYPHISYLNSESDFEADLKYAAWNESGWGVQTVDTFYVSEWERDTSLALDRSGNPHIAYFAGWLKYAKWTGSGWAIEQLVPVSVGWYMVSLALDSDDLSHISYGHEGVAHAELWYSRRTTTGWIHQCVESSTSPGWYSSIALDSNGFPHISHLDGPVGLLKYVKWTGNAWSYQIVDSVSVDWQKGGTSLALDSSNRPHIAYYDAGNRDLKYARWTGGGWNIQVVDSVSDVGQESSMALDGSGYPHVSYYDATNQDLKYASWNGSAWKMMTVDSALSVGRYSSLSLDSTGYPHISYYDSTRQKLKYVVWNGSAWITQTVDPADGVGLYTSLALDSNGHPHIGYYDALSQDLRYAGWTGSGWDIRTVDTAGDVGRHTSLALDSADQAYIAYLDWTNDRLKYAKWTGGSWSVESVTWAGDQSISLAIDGGRRAHISYNGDTLSDCKLMYASGLGNKPPDTPFKPSGPVAGNVGISYPYASSATDPDNDSVRLTFDWGDSTTSQSGYVSPGTQVSLSHSWSFRGSYNVRTMATDIHGSSSGWSASLTVVIAGSPGAPAGLSTAPGNGQITLSWLAPADDGGTPITNYRIYRGTSSGGEAFLRMIGNILSHTDTGLTNGQKYYYKVSAVNAVGEGPKSNEASATPATTPSEPLNLRALPDDRRATLSWSPPLSTGGSPVTNYGIYRGMTSGGETYLVTTGNVLTFEDAGLTNGETYYYQVSAVNAAGEGPRSVEASVIPVTVPGAPTGLAATPGNALVTLTWMTPPDDGGAPIMNYTLYRGLTPGGETFLATVGLRLSYVDAGLNNGQRYYYRVSAWNVVGEGSKSSAVSEVPATVPTEPQNLNATAYSRRVLLTWAPPISNGGSSVTNYTVYRGTIPGGDIPLITLGNFLSHLDLGLTNGVTYYYRVTAVNKAGEGAKSNEVSATPVTLPSAPMDLQAVASDMMATLTWLAPGSNGGSAITNYIVYRGLVSGGETYLVEIGNVLTYVDGGLVNGQTYYYRVSAVNAAGEGPCSFGASSTPATTPSEPLNLQADSGNGLAILTWNASTSNGGFPITSYRLYRGTAPSGETFYTDVGDVLTYTDTGLTNGRTYYYKVSAVNAVGEGIESNEVSATPATIPSEPLALLATAGHRQITLTWMAPVSDGGSPITRYVIYRGASPGGEAFLMTTGNVLTHQDLGLVNGLTYYYRVTAGNAVGQGLNSTETYATPATTPSEPLNLQATAADARVSLTWSEPASDGGSAIARYVVYRGTSPGAETFLVEIGSALTYVDASVTNGQTYYYMVSAKNAIGEGQKSSGVGATPATKPGPPTGLTAVAGIGHLTLTWAAPTDDGGLPITNYRIYRGTSPGGEALLAEVVFVLGYTDTDVVDGQTYYYRVSAKNALGEGPQSNEASATPYSPPNQPPTCTITSPSSSETISGTHAVTGTASDAEGWVERVEIRIDGGDWMQATGTTSWSYELNTTTLPDGPHTIKARSFDGMNHSDVASVTVTVRNAVQPPPAGSILQETWFWIVNAAVIAALILFSIIASMKTKGKKRKEGHPPVNPNRE